MQYAIGQFVVHSGTPLTDDWKAVPMVVLGVGEIQYIVGDSYITEPIYLVSVHASTGTFRQYFCEAEIRLRQESPLSTLESTLANIWPANPRKPAPTPSPVAVGE